MNRKTRFGFVLLGALALTPAAFAADYSLASGAVKFSAPDAWPVLMEKRDGARQFIALQVKNPGDANALARITVTTEQVDGVGGFQKFLNDGTARARKLPGYAAASAPGRGSTSSSIAFGRKLLRAQNSDRKYAARSPTSWTRSRSVGTRMGTTLSR